MNKKSIRQERFTQFWINTKGFDFRFAEEFLNNQDDIIFIKDTINKTGSISTNGLEFPIGGDYLLDDDHTL